MKRSEHFFLAALVPLDYIALVLAGIVSYQIRYSETVKAIRPIIFDLSIGSYTRLVFVFAAIWIVIFALQGLYEIRRTKNYLGEFRKIFLGCTAGIAVVVFAMFFTRYLFDSRFILLLSWFLAICFVSLERIFLGTMQKHFYVKGIDPHRIALVGGGGMAQELFKVFTEERRLGYAVVARLPDFGEESKKQLDELAKNNALDEILQTNPDMPKLETLALVEFANEFHLDYKYVADLLGTKISRFDIQTYADILVMEIKRTPLDGWGRILKRVFDIIFSFVSIVVLFPLMIIAALIIKLDSSGPIFFIYKRIGEKGKVFHFIKFRTMIQDAHKLRYDTEFMTQHKNLREGTPMIKYEDDPRITRFGKFLRKYSIDELPQLFLVLKGHMSLVGPRPHEKEEVERYNRYQKRVLAIKPGITGMAQISGRSDLDFNEEVRLDTFYVEHWSLALDLQIILRTPIAVFRRRKTL